MKVCCSCGVQVGYVYLLKRNGYSCFECHYREKFEGQELIKKLPDVEDTPPIDGKYLTSVIALTEDQAKRIVEMAWDLTPLPFDKEH